MNRHGVIKATLLLAIVIPFLYEFMLHRQIFMFREIESYLLSLQWMLLVCLAVWCGTFLFLAFSLQDLPLIGLLLIAIGACFFGQVGNRPVTDTLTLFAGVTLGKSAPVLLRRNEGTNNPTLVTYLFGSAVLLAFSALWHLDISDNFYHGPRWMGLWNNPNDYGLLMAVGVVLATGLLAANLKSRVHSPQSEESERNVLSPQRLSSGFQPPSPAPASEGTSLHSLCSFAAKWIEERRRRGDESDSGNSETGIGNRKSVMDSLRRPLPIILLSAAGMTGVGLVMSYSRGAWIGTAIGLLYLTKVYGRFKWRWVLPPVLVVAAALCFFWNTPQTAPWYFQRLDLNRGSVQHRVAAWKAGFEMMRDHPFGVGWNNTAEVYRKNYSLLEDGAGAIVTNDYLMLGTQLGWPALVCFVAYVALCFRNRRSAVVPTAGRGGVSPPAATPGGTPGELADETSALRHVCRAGALAMLVVFWFDGGLFKLATASVFWILLELGVENKKLKTETLKAEINVSLVTSAPTSSKR